MKLFKNSMTNATTRMLSLLTTVWCIGMLVGITSVTANALEPSVVFKQRFAGSVGITIERSTETEVRETAKPGDAKPPEGYVFLSGKYSTDHYRFFVTHHDESAKLIWTKNSTYMENMGIDPGGLRILDATYANDRLYLSYLFNKLVLIDTVVKDKNSEWNLLESQQFDIDTGSLLEKGELRVSSGVMVLVLFFLNGDTRTLSLN